MGRGEGEGEAGGGGCTAVWVCCRSRRAACVRAGRRHMRVRMSYSRCVGTTQRRPPGGADNTRVYGAVHCRGPLPPSPVPLPRPPCPCPPSVPPLPASAPSRARTAPASRATSVSSSRSRASDSWRSERAAAEVTASSCFTVRRRPWLRMGGMAHTEGGRPKVWPSVVLARFGQPTAAVLRGTCAGTLFQEGCQVKYIVASSATDSRVASPMRGRPCASVSRPTCIAVCPSAPLPTHTGAA